MKQGQDKEQELMSALNNLASLYLALGKKEEGRNIFAEAVAIGREANQPGALGEVLHNYGW